MKKIKVVIAGSMLGAVAVTGIAYAVTNVYSHQEVEAGSRNSGAVVVSDASASGSMAVKFGNNEQTGNDRCPHRFPTPSCVGLPPGWVSTATYTSDRVVSGDNTVYENFTMDGAVLYVTGENVTIRGVRFINGAGISTVRNDWCAVNTVIEDSSFSADGADWLASGLDATVEEGGYTLKRVYMDGVYEAVRVGGQGNDNWPCGDVAIEKSYIRVSYPPNCMTTPEWDWHGDGLQFYDGQYSSVKDTVILMDGASGASECFGTAPYFLADQCNTGRNGSPPWTTVECSTRQPWYNNTLAAHGGVIADVDGLLVAGGSYPFRTYMPTKVKDLYVKNNDWVYGPIDVACVDVTAGWTAHLATIDGNGQPVAGTALTCHN
jgi:hypothetical protein